MEALQNIIPITTKLDTTVKITLLQNTNIYNTLHKKKHIRLETIDHKNSELRISTYATPIFITTSQNLS